MKVRTNIIGLGLVFLGMLFISRPCDSREPNLEPAGKYGAIDWVGQKITAVGIGTASPEAAQNAAQARVMARRAAEVVARRNLLEAVKGIRIDSRTTVVDYAVRDDTIVSRIQGVLENCAVEGFRYLADGSVEATVSMPLGGQLGGIILQPSGRPGSSSEAAPALNTLEKRIRSLEERIRELEDKISSFRRLQYEQMQMFLLFRELLAEWGHSAAAAPRSLLQAGYVSDTDLAALRNEILLQNGQIAELSKRLEGMAARLKALETPARRPAQALNVPESGAVPAYTGLVVDARRTRFKPCLKPEITFQGQLVYPGDYVNLEKAVRNGYVRYYRKIEGAQQSTLAGSLPLTITAGDGVLGQGSLEIDAEAYRALKKTLQATDNFMANCNVVIVF